MLRSLTLGCVLLAGTAQAAEFDGRWSLDVPQLAGDRSCAATTFEPSFSVQNGSASGQFRHPAFGTKVWTAAVQADGTLQGRTSVAGSEWVTFTGKLAGASGSGTIETAPSACRGPWTAKKG